MNKCVMTLTVIECKHRACQEAQGVDCCWKCQYRKNCTTKCYRFSKVKENKNEKEGN